MKKQLLLYVMMMLPMVASADAVEIDGIYYSLNSEENTAKVTKNTSGYYTGSVVIPDKVTYEITEYDVTSIGSSAFDGCSSLTSIDIPNSVTSIESHAFHGCSSLTSIDIPNSVTIIGNSAFYGCSSLTSIDIPNSVTNIGSQAFWYCSNLNSISISNSVTNIEKETFLGCSSLTSITIPSSVKSIGEWAFFNCENLTSVTSLVEDPFEITSKSSIYSTFSQIVYKNATLYVPVGTIDKYKETIGWKDFEHIEETTNSNLSNICTQPILIQSNGGQLIIQGADNGTQINVYSINGTEAGSAISSNGQATLNTDFQAGSAVIIKIGEKSVKFVVK